MTQRQTAPLQLRDLFADPATGRLSHTRLWSNVGSAVATVLFAKIGWTAELSAEVWAIYLAGVCGSAAISKALSLKYQAQAPQGGYGPAPGVGHGQGGML
jgi:hypothetical protein